MPACSSRISLALSVLPNDPCRTMATVSRNPSTRRKNSLVRFRLMELIRQCRLNSRATGVK